MCHLTAGNLLNLKNLTSYAYRRCLRGEPTSPSSRKLKPANYKPRFNRKMKEKKKKKMNDRDQAQALRMRMGADTKQGSS